MVEINKYCSEPWIKKILGLKGKIDWIVLVLLINQINSDLNIGKRERQKREKDSILQLPTNLNFNSLFDIVDTTKSVEESWYLVSSFQEGSSCKSMSLDVHGLLYVVQQMCNPERALAILSNPFFSDWCHFLLSISLSMHISRIADLHGTNQVLALKLPLRLIARFKIFRWHFLQINYNLNFQNFLLFFRFANWYHKYSPNQLAAAE